MDLSKLLADIILLFQAISWPLIALFFLIYFRAPIKKFFESIGELSIKAGGFEATAKTQQNEASAYLGAAVVKNAAQDKGDQQISFEDNAREIANVVNKNVTPRTIRKLEGTSVLWVDDNPSNNIYERRALEALGIRFIISTSTEDALQKVRTNNYNAIISDMGRLGDKQAGYTLLDALRKQGVRTPFIIYAGSNKPEHKAETIRRGGTGTTNNPQELFGLVINSILDN